MHKRTWGIIGLIVSTLLLLNFLRIIITEENLIIATIIFLIPAIIGIILSVKEVKTSNGN